MTRRAPTLLFLLLTATLGPSGVAAADDGLDFFESRARSSVEHLTEEDPERHQRGVDPILPGRLDLAEGLVEAVGGENVGEGEAALLEELAAEGIDLMAEASVRRQSHGSAPG